MATLKNMAAEKMLTLESGRTKFASSSRIDQVARVPPRKNKELSPPAKPNSKTTRGSDSIN